jgi:hypothetical protein
MMERRARRRRPRRPFLELCHDDWPPSLPRSAAQQAGATDSRAATAGSPMQQVFEKVD